MKGRGFRAEFNYIAVTLLHLTRREFYRMAPGLFFDMVQIHKDAHSPKRENDID